MTTTFDSCHDPTHLYFVTATLIEWQQLFAERAYADIVLNSLDWLRRNGRMLLFAYVVMPSHLHLLIKPQQRAVDEVLQDFGSFTAHAILKQLRVDQRADLLQLLSARRRDVRHQHSIWQDIQAKNVYSAGFLREKLEYLHNNPVDKQRHDDIRPWL